MSFIWDGRKDYPVDKSLPTSKTQAFKELMALEQKKGKWDRFLDWWFRDRAHKWNVVEEEEEKNGW